MPLGHITQDIEVYTILPLLQPPHFHDITQLVRPLKSSINPEWVQTSYERALSNLQGRPNFGGGQNLHPDFLPAFYAIQRKDEEKKVIAPAESWNSYLSKKEAEILQQHKKLSYWYCTNQNDLHGYKTKTLKKHG